MDDKTKNYTGWQSDVIVDLIKRYDFPYITLNPGASFRGLHDSLVNYGGNEPPMMLCNHEEIAGADRARLRQGERQADGGDPAQPGRACCTPAWRSTTPTSTACRSSSWAPPARWTRPNAGRTSTGRTPRWSRATRCATTSSGTTSRTSIDGVPESFARAYSIMMTQPPGPVYMCYDAALQEAPKTTRRAAAAGGRGGDAVADGADPRAIEAIADRAAQGRAPDAAAGVRRPPRRRLREHGGAGRD